MDMKNNVTFTGINNLYTGRKLYSQIGSYITENGNVKQGNKNYKEILIKCNLTDDKNGKDFTEFWNALSRSSNSYQARCLMQNSKDSIRFKVKRCEVEDPTGEVTNSNFELNGVNILLNDRAILPLFTYLAKLTRNLAKISEKSTEKANLLKTANQSIHEEAMKFIENMNP